MSGQNPYCEALGIEVPSVEAIRERGDANYFALLIAVLLERGEPVALPDAAERLERAGVGPQDEVLTSLKRCRPGRPPVYREGELYGLDPQHEKAEEWVSKLELPPRDDSAEEPQPVEEEPSLQDDEQSESMLHTGGTYVRQERKVGRNEPCPCGSGKKYKKCCGSPLSE
jgi:hypothetical protein